jgi:hypothetical protein
MLMEMPRWPKEVDPWMQRTAWGLAITLGILTLITNFIVPFYDIFLILTNLGVAAWYAYLWRKNRNFLNSWWIQYVIVPSLVLAFIEANFYFKEGSAYHLLKGSLWMLTGLAWTAISMRAEYEKYIFLWGHLAKHVLFKERLYRLTNLISDEEKAKLFPPHYSEDALLKVIALMPPERKK